MPEPSRSTGVQPSAEAIEVACSEPIQGRRGQEAAIRGRVTAGLYAAYAVDSPAIRAEGVAEGRAAMLREVVEWLEARLEHPRSSCMTVNLDGFKYRFPSEGTT